MYACPRLLPLSLACKRLKNAINFWFQINPSWEDIQSPVISQLILYPNNLLPIANCFQKKEAVAVYSPPLKKELCAGSQHQLFLHSAKTFSTGSRIE